MKSHAFTSMKIATVVFLAHCISTPPASAQDQGTMNMEARASFEKADKEMNHIYAKLMAKLDAEGQRKLKAAQRAWLTFRDAQADLDADTVARGGTLYTQIYEGTRAALTETRVKDLKGTLDNAGQ